MQFLFSLLFQYCCIFKCSPTRGRNQQILAADNLSWKNISWNSHDFHDGSKSYRWPTAGIAWDGSYLGVKMPPTPPVIIHSSLIDIIETEMVNQRFYLSNKAAKGILRRVDKNKRALFLPLRQALEELSDVF